jgi:hypothetical protein
MGILGLKDKDYMWGMVEQSWKLLRFTPPWESTMEQKEKLKVNNNAQQTHTALFYYCRKWVWSHIIFQANVSKLFHSVNSYELIFWEQVHVIYQLNIVAFMTNIVIYTYGLLLLKDTL